MLGPLDELRVRRGAVIRFVACRRTHRARSGRRPGWWRSPTCSGRRAASCRSPRLQTPRTPQGRCSSSTARSRPASSTCAWRRPGADFYAISGQKWLLGPNGTGALWVHPRHHDRLRPALPSYLTYADGIVGNMRPGAARFDPGTLDLASLAGLAAAVAWVDGLEGGWPAWLALAARAGRDGPGQARRAPASPRSIRREARPAWSPSSSPGTTRPTSSPALAERSVLLRTSPRRPTCGCRSARGRATATSTPCIDGLEAVRAGD